MSTPKHKYVEDAQVKEPFVLLHSIAEQPDYDRLYQVPLSQWTDVLAELCHRCRREDGEDQWSNEVWDKWINDMDAALARFTMPGNCYNQRIEGPIHLFLTFSTYR